MNAWMRTEIDLNECEHFLKANNYVGLILGAVRTSELGQGSALTFETTSKNMPVSH